MILLDTCVVSETLKPQPSPEVLVWMEGLPEDQVYLAAPVIGELKKGIELLPDGDKKNLLGMWVEQLITRFSGRILRLDEKSALIWGHLAARMQKSGRPISVVDAWIAALALQNGALLATRNTADFLETGVSIINPWL